MDGSIPPMPTPRPSPCFLAALLLIAGALPAADPCDPYATLTSSVLGALRLIEMARGKRCAIVHSSTSEIYGDPLVRLVMCREDPDCDNGLYCDGTERCLAGSCQPAAAPVDCADPAATA